MAKISIWVVPNVAQQIMNPASIHEDVSSISGLTQSGIAAAVV